MTEQNMTGEPVPADVPQDVPAAIGSDPADSPYEPAPSLPAARVGSVAGEVSATSPGRRRAGLRWAIALIGVAIVAAASFAIVSLVGGRPATSAAMGYMPTDTVMYAEVRLDLPGDQRQKLASFLKPIPGFDDASQFDVKLNEALDRFLSAATDGKQTWTRDIQPWFAGQIAVGTAAPAVGASTSAIGRAGGNSVVVLTISDRAKALAWLNSIPGVDKLTQSSYGGADLIVGSGGSGGVALTDKVMLLGTTDAVKAAVDSGGKGTFAQTDEVKAALATIDKDYVVLGVTRTRAYADAVVKGIAATRPGLLDATQIDDTILALIPAWNVTSARFENDSLVTSTAGPSWAIGHDAANRASTVVGHVPANTLLYVDVHDAGPTLKAILDKFRALPEAKAAFAQLDQALSLFGGYDATVGWWSDTALVVSPVANGSIGAGLVIKPTDAAAADRLFTTLGGFVTLAGGSTGITARTEDHNGTKITTIDLSGVPSIGAAKLPAGAKPELAWATNADIAVLGSGRDFVAAVLDAGPGNSLGSDVRFGGLLGRVGAENIGQGYVDLAGIRALAEPLAQRLLPADKWSFYATEVRPYLKPFDAIVSALRKDGALDRGTGALTTH